MRTFARFTLAFAVVCLIAGPALAAPIAISSGPTVSSASHSPVHALSPLELLGYGLATFGAIRIKDAGTLAKKFVQRAGAAAGDYKDGVTQAGGDWETNTKGSEANYAQGVQDAIGRGAFGKGVSAAGAGKYVNRASTLGAQRYPSGVQAAEGAWAQGAQPYLQALSSIQLPPRRPKGDPANQQRANAVAAQLRAMKVGK